MARCDCGELAGFRRAICADCEQRAREIAAAAAASDKPLQPWQVHPSLRARLSSPPAEGPPKRAGPGMLTLGFLILILGILGAVYALNMDTSVAADVYGRERINNLGLMNDRLIYLLASGFAAVVGAVMSVGGAILLTRRRGDTP